MPLQENEMPGSFCLKFSRGVHFVFQSLTIHIMIWLCLVTGKIINKDDHSLSWYVLFCNGVPRDMTVWDKLDNGRVVPRIRFEVKNNR